MRELITDEMVEAAHAVINREIGAECPTPSECAACDAQQATTAILEAVAPLIAAAALRDAADWLDDMARGHRESAYLNAGRDLISRLRARADWIKKEGMVKQLEAMQKEEDDDTRDSDRD